MADFNSGQRSNSPLSKKEARWAIRENRGKIAYETRRNNLATARNAAWNPRILPKDYFK